MGEESPPSQDSKVKRQTMSRMMSPLGMRCTKQLALGVGPLSLTSALGAGGYLIPHFQNRATAEGVEVWSMLSRGAITLNASWFWALQKPLYCPEF